MDNMNKSNPSKIIGVQFSILSPEEIRKGSVAEITSRDTYVNNKPVIGGLFDPRMGVLDSGIICPTDGHNFINTPGYFGHIELAKPVFYIQYITTILKIIKCVCIKCSKLLIDKTKYTHLLKYSSEDRWANVFIVRHEKEAFLFTERGELIIARMTPKGYTEVDRVKILNPTTPAGRGRLVLWSHPAFANQAMIARNDKEIVRVSLASSQK